MGAIILKQPNGKYCRWSTVVDGFTHINMSKEDYVKIVVAKARRDAEYDIDNCERVIPPFDQIQIIHGRGDGKSSKTLKLIETLVKMNDPNGAYEEL